MLGVCGSEFERNIDTGGSVRQAARGFRVEFERGDNPSQTELFGPEG